jgi:HPt (histidine-containing phosphotransfer) domain-containing protein
MSLDRNIIIDLIYLREVSDNSSEFMIEMIEIFQAQTPGYVDQLEAALKVEEWIRVAEMAHKIKPTLTFMGVEPARVVMASIETRARNGVDFEGIKSDFEDLKEIFRIIYLKLEDKKKELQAQGKSS